MLKLEIRKYRKLLMKLVNAVYMNSVIRSQMKSAGSHLASRIVNWCTFSGQQFGSVS